MGSRALDEESLRRFLRRRRKRRGAVALPPLGQFLAETLELAGRLVPSETGCLLLDDPAMKKRSRSLTYVASVGPSAARLIGVEVPGTRGIVGHVYRTGRLYATAEPERDPRFFGRVDHPTGFTTRSLVVAPIRLERTVCGVLELVNRKGRKTFSDRDIELVDLIARYVSRAIMNAVDIIKQNDLALIDGLTELSNDRALHEHLDSSLKHAMREHADLTVMFADVDRLKRINDRLGHRIGSEALRRTARALDAVLGVHGTAFRFGGDEFVVVCPRMAMKDAIALAQKIIDTLGARTKGPVVGGGTLPPVTMSIGVATLEASLKDRTARAKHATRLVAAADAALYRAKRAGRGRVAKATPRDDRLD